MDPDDRRHRPRFGRALLWGAAAALVVMALALLPKGWIEPIRGLFRGDDTAHDAFSDVVARVDQALAAGEVVPVSRERYEAQLRPRVQVRRLLSAGRLTSEGVRRAQVMLEEFDERERAEASQGSRQAVRELRDRRLAEAFPRLVPEAITRELEALRRQEEVAEFSAPEASGPTTPGSEGGATAAGDCVGCHVQTRPLPEGHRLDVNALWPRLDPTDLDEGQAFPLLLDGLEYQVFREELELDGAEGCLECHRPHGAEGFEITTAEREANMGLWLHTFAGQGLVGGKVKAQNRAAPHRVPAGFPERGYALVVSARAGDQPLRPWWGPRLPEALRDEERVLGRLFSRQLVDPTGAAAGRLDAVDIVADTRLQPGRFSDDIMLFLPPEEGAEQAWEMTARLYWLPDARSWEGAVEVDRVVRRGGVADEGGGSANHR